MRKRFEQQLVIGQIPINEIQITSKCRDAFPKLLKALQKIFTTSKYNEKIFSILEGVILKNKHKTGRPGMSLWQIFVLSQVRLCLNISYDRLHDLANNHALLRQILGIETKFGYEKIEFDYQYIYDNAQLLNDEAVRELNEVIVKLGHEVFKKKEAEALCLKTDSFVLESNIHFPTDYNLLYDSVSKSLKIIKKLGGIGLLQEKWRKINYWTRTIKNLCRNLGEMSRKGGANKKKRQIKVAEKLIIVSRDLLKKIHNELNTISLDSEIQLKLAIELEYYLRMLIKHIDLVERRILKGEKIPQSEKIFSIFESYTEWINKGKRNVELGKNLSITTDQYNLIVDYHIHEKETDSQIVVALVDRLLQKFNILSWSFDRGYWNKKTKDLVKLFIDNVVMPKRGKKNKQEKEEESQKKFKSIKSRHSTVESNINELEHKGLDRCPDRSYPHFKRYTGLGICAYNLHRIGAELIKQDKKLLALRQVA